MSSLESAPLPAGPTRRVAGVPGDLVRLIRSLGQPTGAEVLSRFYLPADLTTAYIEKGVELGVLRRSRAGRLTAVAPAATLAMAEPDAVGTAHGGGDTAIPAAASFLRVSLAIIARRAELETGKRVLALGGDLGLALCLAAPGAAVTVLDALASLRPVLERHGATMVRAESRFARGSPFGAFDLVIGWQTLEPIDETALATALANVATYGAHYVGVAVGGRDRQPLISLLSRLETHLIITDMVEDQGLVVFRGVKYPEMRGNPEFMRYYVR
jgi:hypothetical protein